MFSRRIRNRDYKERTRYTPSVISGDGTEPFYQSGVNTLIVDDTFDGYASSTTLRSAYGAGRNLNFVSLITGFSGSGGAARWSYGIGFTDDILYGREGFSGHPFTEIYAQFTMRFSVGADPADHNIWGIKGFMFWDENFASGGSGTRYEAAFNRGDGGSNNGPTRWLKFFNLSNATSGLNVWKTADGFAPLLSASNDGNPHRVTFYMRTGAISNRGAKIWLDGTTIYDDQGVDVVSGQSPFEGYAYDVPIGGFQGFGNFIDSGASMSNPFTIDVDHWTFWLP